MDNIVGSKYGFEIINIFACDLFFLFYFICKSNIKYRKQGDDLACTYLGICGITLKFGMLDMRKRCERSLQSSTR